MLLLFFMIQGNRETLPVLNFFLLYGATSLAWQYLSVKFIFQFRVEPLCCGIHWNDLLGNVFYHL